MKRRLKIYFVHSLKYDYNNMLYRDLLTDSVLNKHELMLPMSNAYKEKYSKDLINKADLIVCEVSTPSFTEKLELKWVSKVSTPKLYFSFNNTVPKTFNKYVPEIKYTNNDVSYTLEKNGEVIANNNMPKEGELTYLNYNQELLSGETDKYKLTIKNNKKTEEEKKFNADIEIDTKEVDETEPIAKIELANKTSPHSGKSFQRQGLSTVCRNR